MTSAQSLRRPRFAGPSADSKRVAVSAAWSLEWFYFVLVIAGWCFTPLLRRLLDWHNGFYNPVQITSTIPFALTLPLALTAFRADRLARIAPTLKMFAWVWLATFGYGLLLAVAVGNTSAGVYESIQYLVPMLVGIWIAGADLDGVQLMGRLSRIAFPLGVVVAAYGIVQFAQPPAWDVLWIEGGQFTSMGDPVPFAMRIFSTLNSTGPAADFFAIGIIFALPFCRLKNVWVWPLMTLLGCALLLTLVREAWVALVIGLVVYLVISPARFRTLPFLALYGVLLAFLIAALPALLGAGQNSDIITSRISTLGDVSHDDSALARSNEIQNSIQQGLANPIGRGLGQIGASAALSANPDTVSGNSLDSGYLARLLELGWAGFCGYVFVAVGSFVALVAALYRAKRDSTISIEAKTIIATAGAMCAMLIWSDAASDVHLGLDGLLFWIALGIGLRRPAAPAPAPAARLAMARKLR
jgi:putative inorganic carbon (HCO3(-)) transporter